MATTNEKVISILNDLVETCRDGEEGFHAAAEGIQDAELKALLEGYSEQRSQFAADLRGEVVRLGGDAENRGSLAGAVHRGWMNIRSAVTGKDEDAVISECERGEDMAVRSYQEALNQDLPDDVRMLIQNQYTQVKEAHDNIRALERSGSPQE